MAILLPPAKQQFFDANGVVCAMGTVTLYVPGTTVLKDSWQDSGQSALNTNPIALDGGGYATIYGNGSYRQIAKDRLGNIIWDRVVDGYTATPGNRVAYTTYAAMAAVSTFPVNTTAEVTTLDAGTHTDPVLGGTVNNSGVFRYSTTPPGWQRMFDFPSVGSGTPGATGAAGAPGAAGANGTPGVNGAVGSSAGISSLFSAAPGMVVGAGITTVQTAGYAAASVGGANYVYDAAVNAAFVTANPRTSFQAADTRGFRLDPTQRLTVEMFGAVGDYAAGTGTDNYAAIIAAAEFNTSTANKYGLPIYFTKRYYSLQTIEPNAVFTFVGTATGISNGGATGQASEITTPVNVTVVRIKCGTVGAAGAGGIAGQTNAGGSLVRGMKLSQATQGTDLTAHGIDCRSTPILEDCYFNSIAGNPINITGWTDGGGRYGTPNVWRVINCHAANFGGDGLRVAGSDANAGVSVGFNASPFSGGCGIQDTSYYSNGHYGFHLSGYGNAGVFYSGSNYQLLVSTNTGTTPGTNATIWLPLNTASAATANFPAWVNTTAYLAALPYLVTNGSPVEGYVELGAVQGHAPNSVVRGTLSATPATTFLASGPSNQFMSFSRGIGRARNATSTQPSFINIASGESVSIGGLDYNNGENGRGKILSYIADIQNAGGDTFEMLWSNNQNIFVNGVGRTMMVYTGKSTTLTFGRSAAVRDMAILQGFAIGAFTDDGSNPANTSASTAKIQMASSGGVAPTGGSHARGEFCWNFADTGATGILGWFCTIAGTPGTWTPIPLLGPKQTGWTASTGTPLRGVFAAAAATAPSAAYVQAEATASATRIAALEARLIALEADVRTFGIIN